MRLAILGDSHKTITIILLSIALGIILGHSTLGITISIYHSTRISSCQSRARSQTLKRCTYLARSRNIQRDEIETCCTRAVSISHLIIAIVLIQFGRIVDGSLLLIQMHSLEIIVSTMSTILIQILVECIKTIVAIDAHISLERILRIFALFPDTGV